LRRKTGQYELIGDSIAVQKLRSSINKIGPTNSRVLITGPSGSGKELVARALHKNSERASASFVVINAAILEPENMEYVLFGRIEDGDVMPGLLEQAHGGSLYIDEVGEMPLDTQGKILRVLTEQKFVRIGGGPNVSVDIRVMSSSSRDLTNHIAKGLFREDLYHRLNVVPIEVPSLAQRREDIGMLVDIFVDYLVNSSGFAPRKIAPDALAVMQSHAWPGNVRQLRNCVENMLISAADSEHDTITADMLPADILSATKLNIEESDSTHIMTLQLREAREIFEKQYLLAQIDRFGGNISKTAEFVGMERSALHRKLKTLGVNPTKHLKPA
jgi:two-component system nitrogen regulation response regulator NtrX